MDQHLKNGYETGSGNLKLNHANWIERYGRWAPLCHLTVYTNMTQIDVASQKAKMTLKQLAAKGDTKSARILAKEVVRSNKQKDKLHVSKARLGSIGVQLNQQLGVCLLKLA